MSSDECNCNQCNNCDDPYADEHEENCCCDDCHDWCHQDDPRAYADICGSCEDIVTEMEKEEANGNDQQQKN